MPENGEGGNATNPYAQWMENYERMGEAWLRLTPWAEQGRAFHDTMRGMMNAAQSSGWPMPGANAAAGGQPDGADMFAAWRTMRDSAMQSWASTMSNMVNTPGYAEAMGTMLGAYAAMGEPFEKAMEQGMSRALHGMNMPTRADITQVLERLTHIEKRLDDLAAQG